MNKKGKIIPNGVSLEKHENDTIVFFTNLGFDIELIPPSNIPTKKAITEINTYLKASKRVKRIKIITRERELIDLNK